MSVKRWLEIDVQTERGMGGLQAQSVDGEVNKVAEDGSH